MGPIGTEMKRLTADTEYVDGILRKGGDRARDLARQVIEEVYDAVGFMRP